SVRQGNKKHITATRSSLHGSLTTGIMEVLGLPQVIFVFGNHVVFVFQQARSNTPILLNKVLLPDICIKGSPIAVFHLDVPVAFPLPVRVIPGEVFSEPSVDIIGLANINNSVHTISNLVNKKFLFICNIPFMVIMHKKANSPNEVSVQGLDFE